MRPLFLVTLLAALSACGDSGKPSVDPSDTTEPSGAALPEGPSEWTGTMEVAGMNFLTDFELELTGGDVQGTITFRDDPEAPAGFGEGTFEVRGTHEPVSGLLALAPYRWVDEPDVISELLGFIGAYDPEDEALVGTVVDYATGDDNVLRGGPLRATRVSGDGAPVGVGAGAKGLSAADHAFSGALQCTGPVRDVEGVFAYDGAGAVEGTMTVGDVGVDNPLGTFAFTGVHNPSTGGITLVPGLWTQSARSVLTYFVHGSYDPATRAFDGDQLTTDDSCPRGAWTTLID